MNLNVCITGKSFSGNFLDCWSLFLSKCIQKGINVNIFRKYSPNIYLSRNMCLEGNILLGKNQLPFRGKEYDYILFIDNDILFDFSHFAKLLSCDKDIIGGLYYIDSERLCAVENMDSSYFQTNGVYEHLTPTKVKNVLLPIPIIYMGFGFMLLKRGVFEKMEYPWFKPIIFQMDEITDIMTEDVSFCLMTKQNGFTVYADPQVILSHEKTITLP